MFEVATIGPVSILVVLLVALVVLGPKRATDLGRSAITALENFRHALSSREAPDESPPPGSSQASEQRRLESGERPG